MVKTYYDKAAFTFESQIFKDYDKWESYQDKMWRQEILGEFSKSYDKQTTYEHGLTQVEKAIKEDSCKKCGKSFHDGNKIQDIVTLHRTMGGYWIYHIVCFEELAGPDNFPPQNKLSSSREVQLNDQYDALIWGMGIKK